MDDPLPHFAANLRRLRESRGLTQEQLALAAGLQITDVSRIEIYGRDPGVRTIVKLARGLDVDPGELFVGVRP